MQPRSLLPFLLLALGVSAIPAHVKRDDVPNYVNSDGSIDFSALTADAAIVPTIVAPAQASDVILPIDTDAISEDVVSQAANQADSTPAKRGLLTKRATAPTWAGYATCGPQSVFSQAKTVNSPDTPDAFRADPTLAQTAKTAAKPSGYTLDYVALNGVYQSSTANSYLGSTILTSAQGYSPQYCASYCDTKVKGCLGFNIYFERDPSIAITSTTNLAKCNNPPSATTIACQFYGSPLNAAAATSTGQVRGNYFRTAKAGSNGYSKAMYAPAAISGFNSPVTFGGGKIDNQKVVGSIAGSHLLTVNPDFNPQYCADVANKYYPGKYSSFETFMLKKNGAYVGQMCIVLTKTGFVPADANDAGQFGGKSPTYDETSIWFSSQPVYYYELPPVATTPTSEETTPVEPVPAQPTPPEPENPGGEVVTFEREQYYEDMAVSWADGDALLVPSTGFFSFWNEVPNYNAIWTKKHSALAPKSGQFGSCIFSGPCRMTPVGTEFTFDLKRIDLADLDKQAGAITLVGYRDGVSVITYSVSSSGDWQTYTLPAGFSNLERLKIVGPGTPAFDNIYINKYPVPV